MGGALWGGLEEDLLVLSSLDKHSFSWYDMPACTLSFGLIASARDVGIKKTYMRFNFL